MSTGKPNRFLKEDLKFIKNIKFIYNSKDIR